MTFSVLATDGKGAVGMAVSSSSPAVGARCIHLRNGVGGAASQNVTDPRLGPELLDALAAGRSPAEALADITRNTPTARHRQLAVVDLAGRTAHFSGSQTLGVHAAAEGPGVVSAGNLLADAQVPGAVVTAFGMAEGELEERLLIALAAGLEAGGEAGPVQSAALSVVRQVSWRETDLRIDWHEDPISELRRLLDRWLPQRDDYVTRAIDPDAAPSYGVPGDEGNR